MTCKKSCTCALTATVASGIVVLGTGDGNLPFNITRPDGAGYPAGQGSNSATSGFAVIPVSATAAASTSTAPVSVAVNTAIGTAAVSCTVAASSASARLVTFVFQLDACAIALASTPNDWSLFQQIAITVNGVSVSSGVLTVIRARTGASPLNVAPVITQSPVFLHQTTVFVPANQPAVATSTLQYITPVYTANATNFIQMGTRFVSATAVGVQN